jgi:hypothetical protein
MGCGGGRLRDETAEVPVGTPEAAAKAVVQEFVAALRDGKKAAVLMASDTPYFNHHDFNVIDTREELEHAYEEVFEPWTRSKPLPKAITEISRYRDQRAALREPVRRRLDHVLGEEDFIVTLGNGPDEERYLHVRVREGVAKVVGVTTR